MHCIATTELKLVKESNFRLIILLLVELVFVVIDIQYDSIDARKTINVMAMVIQQPS